MIDKRHPVTGARPAGAVPLRLGGSTGVIGSFGYTRDKGSRMHKGADYPMALWDPIYAAHDGTIVRSGFQVNKFGEEKNEGYGSRIWLQYDETIETRYAHLIMQVFNHGMEINAGEIIGFAGSTGNAPPGDLHLHFETRLWDPVSKVYVPVNPVWWLHGTGNKMGVVVDYR